jgi:hypothetical protein
MMAAINLIVGASNLIVAGVCWEFSKTLSALNAFGCVLNLAFFVAQVTA